MKWFDRVRMESENRLGWRCVCGWVGRDYNRHKVELCQEAFWKAKEQGI